MRREYIQLHFNYEDLRKLNEHAEKGWRVITVTNNSESLNKIALMERDMPTEGPTSPEPACIYCGKPVISEHPGKVCTQCIVNPPTSPEQDWPKDDVGFAEEYSIGNPTSQKSANDDSLECQRMTTSPEPCDVCGKPSSALSSFGDGKRYHRCVDHLWQTPISSELTFTTTSTPATSNGPFPLSSSSGYVNLKTVHAPFSKLEELASENADLRRQLKALETELEDLNNAFCAEERLRVSLERQVEELTRALAESCDNQRSELWEAAGSGCQRALEAERQLEERATGEFRWVCPFCPKAKKNENELKRHIRKHLYRRVFELEQRIEDLSKGCVAERTLLLERAETAERQLKEALKRIEELGSAQ